MDDVHDISALILAAGLSSRMGAFKPLLTFGTETVIERVIDIFRKAGIEDILVVAGFNAENLIPVLQANKVRWVINEEYRQGMFSSIKKGLLHLDKSRQAFFVLPADMPFVKPETLLFLMQMFRENEAAVCRPCYQERRGHPPLISATLLAEIMKGNDSEGLRGVLAGHEPRTINVDCNDPGVLIDIDDMDDYRKLLISEGNE